MLKCCRGFPPSFCFLRTWAHPFPVRRHVPSHCPRWWLAIAIGSCRKWKCWLWTGWKGTCILDFVRPLPEMAREPILRSMVKRVFFYLHKTKKLKCSMAVLENAWFGHQTWPYSISPSFFCPKMNTCKNGTPLRPSPFSWCQEQGYARVGWMVALGPSFFRILPVNVPLKQPQIHQRFSFLHFCFSVSLVCV